MLSSCIDLFMGCFRMLQICNINIEARGVKGIGHRGEKLIALAPGPCCVVDLFNHVCSDAP